jgi:hypothetical protein
VAILIVGSKLCNTNIRFYCENMTVVDILNNASSRSSKTVMCLVRLLVFHCMKLNILLKAVHVPGRYSVICDAQSKTNSEN